jgi:hypothetical protein
VSPITLNVKANHCTPPKLTIITPWHVYVLICGQSDCLCDHPSAVWQSRRVFSHERNHYVLDQSAHRAHLFPLDLVLSPAHNQDASTTGSIDTVLLPRAYPFAMFDVQS